MSERIGPCGLYCPGDCGWDPADPADPCAPAPAEPVTEAQGGAE